MNTTPQHNIHIRFIDMCTRMYKESTPSIQRKEYTHRSLAYSTTLLFLKHIATAEQLTKHLKDIDNDIKERKHTPATLLAKAYYSKEYIEIMMHSQIHKHMHLATEMMSIIPAQTPEYATI